MDNMIIDVHMHIGDFLHENGQNTFSQHHEMPNTFNIQRFEEDILKFNRFKITNFIFDKFDDYYTLSVNNRIKAGTYENLKKYFSFLEETSQLIFGDSKIRSFCMPIAPYVTFDNIYSLSHKEKRLLAFNSISAGQSIDEVYTALLNTLPYCYGLKLHPILQGIPFNSDYTYTALDIFRGKNKPILLHAGSSRYYIGKEKRFQHCELDDPFAAREMICRYPEIIFIIGHAGIAEYKEWAEIFYKYDNVFFDITVQSVKAIKELIRWYGEDRMLFATDWPCVNPKTTFGIVRKALNDTQMEKLLYKNALSIFGEEILFDFPKQS